MRNAPGICDGGKAERGKPLLVDREASFKGARQVQQLLDFSFLDERANIVFIGPPGVGKPQPNNYPYR